MRFPVVFFTLVFPFLVGGAPAGKAMRGLSAAPRTVDLRDHPAWIGGRATFVLRNGSDQPVSLVKVRTSCGCAKASVPEGDIAPGNGAELVVEIKANTLRGPYTKHVFVHWRQERAIGRGKRRRLEASAPGHEGGDVGHEGGKWGENAG